MLRNVCPGSDECCLSKTIRIRNGLPGSVGTRGAVGWMRGPCACPGADEIVPAWRHGKSQAPHPGQAQGPHPTPHPPLVPTERGRPASIPPFGCHISSESDTPLLLNPIRSATFMWRSLKPCCHSERSEESAFGPARDSSLRSE